MPAVIYLTKDKEGYQYQKIDYPQDGDAYEKFVQAMFPQKLQKNALNGQKYDSRLTQQKEAYAKVYLKSLRRKAEVGE